MSRHASRMIFAAGLLLPVLLAPVLADGASAIALSAAVSGGALAWISPALPVGLDGAPGVLVALTGSNPLPAGGTVTLLSLWGLLGVAFAVARRPGIYPLTLFLRPPIVLSVGLAALMMIRLGSSPASGYGSSKLQLFALVNVTGIVTGAVIARRRADFDLLVVVLFGVAVLASIALLQALLTGSAQQVFAGRRSLSESYNPILLARTLAEGALLCVHFLATRYANMTLRIVGFAMLPVFAVTLIATGSRGPLLALVAGLLVLLALVLRQGRGVRTMITFLAALVASVVVVPHVLDAPGAVDRALSVFTDGGAGLSSNGRDTLWTQATDLIRSHPFAGVGTGGFEAFEQIERYPHNIVLEVGAELGVLGLALLVGVIATGLAYLHRAWQAGHARERSQVALAAALLATALVDASLSGDITGNGRLWFCVGLAVGLAWRVADTRFEHVGHRRTRGAPHSAGEPASTRLS